MWVAKQIMSFSISVCFSPQGALQVLHNGKPLTLQEVCICSVHCALQGVCGVPMCLAGGMWCTYVPCRRYVVYLCALQGVCGVPMCLAGGM